MSDTACAMIDDEMMNQEENSVRVMLVDDHPVVRAGYRLLLEEADGITVAGEASSGEEALSQYDKLKPDVVVLDLSMPGIGGLESLRRILARDSRARVLIFTIHDSDIMLHRTLEAGAAGFLGKLGTPEKMVEAIRTVARGETYLDATSNQSLAQRKNQSVEPVDILSPREFQIFQLLAERRTVIQIASDLSISPKTAGVHHTNIMKKLGLRGAAELVRLAIRSGVATV